MAGLADGIMPARFRPGDTMPMKLDRDEVVRLLATTAGDRSGDVRARAVPGVQITCGLRAGESNGCGSRELVARHCPEPDMELRVS